MVSLFLFVISIVLFGLSALGVPEPARMRLQSAGLACLSGALLAISLHSK